MFSALASIFTLGLSSPLSPNSSLPHLTLNLLGSLGLAELHEGSRRKAQTSPLHCCVPRVSTGSLYNRSSLSAHGVRHRPHGALWKGSSLFCHIPSTCSLALRVSAVLRGQARRKGLLTKHLSDSLDRGERRRVLIAWSLRT